MERGECEPRKRPHSVKWEIMRIFFLVGMLCLGAGCSPNNIGQNIRQAVEDNQNTPSKREWDSSAVNPDELFSRWRDEAQNASDSDVLKMQREICETLEELDAQALSLFESHLRESQNQALVSTCQERLLKKIDDFFADASKEKRKSVWFRTIIEKRDVTQGYRAVTGDLRPKRVVLTFDDGPSGVYTPRLLKILKDVNAKAIFFSLGKNASNNPQILRDILKEGHALGSHTWSHPCIGSSTSCASMHGKNFSYSEAVAEIQRGHAAIFSVTGVIDPFFRFPYGESSPELRQYLADHGVADFLWSVDSEDWRAQAVEQLIQKTMSQIERRQGGIVLFHDIQRRTVEAMPQFLETLFEKGYEIVLLQAEDSHAKYNPRIIERPKP